MQLACEFVDTEEFQRLRDLKQLGEFSSHTWEPILESLHSTLLGVSEFYGVPYLLFVLSLLRKFKGSLM